MRTKLAMLAAGSAAALALGAFAAPANADDVGIQATVGAAYITDNGTGVGTPLVDDVLDTCLPIGIPAQSGLKTSSSVDIFVYTNQNQCENDINAVELTPVNTLVDWPGIKLFYRVTAA